MGREGRGGEEKRKRKGIDQRRIGKEGRGEWERKGIDQKRRRV